MSDKDLIRREDVADRAFRVLKFLTELEREGKIHKVYYSILYHDIGAIAFSPTAPQEMSVSEYVHERDRMCAYHNVFCEGCPALPERMEGKQVMHNCPIWSLRVPDKAIAIVEKWAREHPERSEE